MTDKEVAANFSFLTVDDAVDEDSNSLYHKKKDLPIIDTHGNKVFVWGLNDVHQLGTGPIEGKVSHVGTVSSC